MDFVVLIFGALGLSLILNACLIFKLFHQSRPLTTDASALIHELTRGKAVVEIRVLDAAGLMYRSPRG